MFYGLWELPWYGYLIVTAVLTHITALGITIFLHRCQAHRALTMHPALGHFFRFWLWLTTGMETKAWTAIHRKHHARCETSEDPHSPIILGIRTVLWQGAELYRKEAKNKETLERYGKGTPDDWLERHLYTKYSSKGIFVALFLNLIIFGVPGVIVWSLQMMWTPFFAAGIINGIGHYWGYRNFECPDAARNIVPWGIIIVGEELHNNHHTFGSSAKLSVKPWEFDLGWAYIKLFSWMGLVKINRLPPELHINPHKHTIDVETVKALFSNRFSVMSRYSKEVIAPAFNEIYAKCKRTAHQQEKLSHRIKRLMVREDSLVDADNKRDLIAALEKHHTLNIVYQFRNQLLAIWEKTTATPKELTEALQEWCAKAEATGIQVLREFARTLTKYSLRTTTKA